MKYDLDSLIKTFKRHSLEVQKENAKFKLEFPDAKIDEFILCHALLQICIDLKKIKDKIGD